MKIGKITEELKQLIIEQNDLEEVAAEYGVLFNANGKAKCPFHKDGRNGNLHLHRKKGEHPTYHCYADHCQAGTYWEDKKKTVRHVLTFPDGEQIEDGGPSVIGFVMNMERCSYIEACVILMNRAGIPIPEGKENYKEKKLKQKYTSLNVEYCKTLMKTPEVLQYLEKRGVKKESIKKWRLGYIEPDNINNGSIFKERVAGRLVFGLKEETYDVKGAKTIAFAYRAMTKEQLEHDAKYLNDATSDLYEKRSYLYGLNEARQAIKKNRCAIVVEGYMDTIIAHQTGLENTVATCGTSFTIEQMQKLRKLTDTLIFWFDGDGPGFNAMLNDIETLFELGFRVKMVVAPGKDPAEWMNELGQDYERVVNFMKEHSRPAIQVLSDVIIQDYEQEVRKLQKQFEAKLLEKKTEALDELLAVAETIKEPTQKILFNSLIEQKLGVRI